MFVFQLLKFLRQHGHIKLGEANVNPRIGSPAFLNKEKARYNTQPEKWGNPVCIMQTYVFCNIALLNPWLCALKKIRWSVGMIYSHALDERCK